MKLGIGLPNTMAHETDRRLMLDWARLADQAGFHELAVIDKPNYDSWDPLATLAAAAAVTERARLATTILQLPNRDEVLVAKQAATIDRVSNSTKALEEATHHVLRYYGQLWTEPEKLIHHGPGSVIAEAARGYAEAGLDILILFPQIPDLRQVEWLARDVLPSVPVRPTLGVPAERNSVSGPRTGAPRR
jgi:hypothetical protein